MMMFRFSIARSEWLCLFLLLNLTIFLAFFNLDGYPRFSFDEGSYCLLAENLVRHGEFALSSPPQETDWFGWGTSLPTVVLPIAASFKWLGIGILQARLVAAVYLVGMVWAGYFCMRRLYDWQTAWLGSLLLLVAGPSAEFNTLTLGRRVSGETPMLFFLLIGLYLWFRSWEHDRVRELIGTGMVLGLAFVTKEQSMPPVWGVVAVIWLADRFYYHQLKMRYFLIPGIVSLIPVSLWYVYKYLVLGPQAFTLHLSVMNAVSGASTWIIAPDTWRDHIGYVYSSGFFLIGLPGILYAFTQSVRRDRQGLRNLLLPIFTSFSMLWYVFLTIGWARYAYTGMAMANLLAGKPLADLMRDLSLNPRRLWNGLLEGVSRHSLVAALVAIGVMGYPLLNAFHDILLTSDRSPQDMATLIEKHTEPNTVIEMLEWEIAFLTPRKSHHPPPAVFVQLLKNTPDNPYNPLAYESQYLIDGPYSKATRLYSKVLQNDLYQKVGTSGVYDLYRKR
jgi:hypothetical protein